MEKSRGSGMPSGTFRVAAAGGMDGLRPLEDEGVEGVSHAALLGREVQARGLARAKAALGQEAGHVLGMIKEQRGWIREEKWCEKIQEERGPNHGDQ